MARSDLLVNLVRAGTNGDNVLFRRTVEAVIAEERAKNHHVLAEQLAQTLNSHERNGAVKRGLGSSQLSQLLYETMPQRRFADLILNEDVRVACEELVEEQHRSDLLRSYNIEPRHRVMLVGPPGNGKTSLAEAIAEALMVPLLVVRYEGIIGSYLGETASRIQSLFDFVRTQHSVLFFDEFDVLGKERGDQHETGEIKRVVSSLLLQIDSLPSHVVIVTATNHSELLDRAVWRRFQLRLELPQPNRMQLEELLVRFEERLGRPLGYNIGTLAAKLGGMSFAEAEEFVVDIQRRYILSLPNSNMKSIVAGRLKQRLVRPGALSNNEEHMIHGDR